MVSVMTANNEIGTINDVGALAAEAHSRGALFHTDAVQAVGHIPIDVRKLDVDLLSASAHKFNGPKGIGFLFVRKGLKLASLLDGGQQEDGRRAGTENVAAIVGMAARSRRTARGWRGWVSGLTDWPSVCGRSWLLRFLMPSSRAQARRGNCRDSRASRCRAA
ncbi:MAG: aminotransferase class V-fold PLP-dependent enzyme [Kiritimatiellae bacterium]|nr:aminotransferase class V-fold PLP-dependent enzyme [Kiritimatiellia bacterium]